MDYLRGRLKGRSSVAPLDLPRPSLESRKPRLSPRLGRRSPGPSLKSRGVAAGEDSPPPSIFGRRWREGSERSRTFFGKSTPWSRRGSQGSVTADESSSKYESGSKYDSSSKYESYYGSKSNSRHKYETGTNSFRNETGSGRKVTTLRGEELLDRSRSPAQQYEQDDSYEIVDSSSYADRSSFSDAPSSPQASRSSLSAAPSSPQAVRRNISSPVASASNISSLQTDGPDLLCSRCSSMSPTPLIEYNPIDYKSLFEKERQEKQIVSKKVEELEGRQKLLEQSLSKFLDLRKELKDLNTQAVEADSLIDSIIKEAVPDFGGKRRKNSPEEDDSYNESRNRLKLFRGGRMELGQPLSPTPARHTSSPPPLGSPVYRANPVMADPDLPCTPSPPPLPRVSYEWDECSTTPSPHSSTRFSYSSRIPSRLDELKLNLRYDVSSSLLPTKLELEVKNKEGKVVFRKRQNLYYVKVQERLSTLDAGEDYVMTVTSISGNRKASEDVTIHNKNYVDDTFSRSYTTPGYEVTESVTLPFTETCRSPSNSSMTSGFDEKSIDSIFDAPIKSIEATYEEVYRAATETPVPDLEEIQVETNEEPEIASDSEPQEEEMETETEIETPVEEIKRNPFTLLKKPIVPELKYRWQHGFRRTQGSGYTKVPILKVQFRYSESPALLPTTLQVGCGLETREVVVGPTGGVVEFVFPEGVPAETIQFNARDKTGQSHLSSPKFSLSARVLAECNPGEWYSEVPILQLEI